MSGCKLLLCYFMVFCSLSAQANNENIVILLAWDGMRHDFPDRANYPGFQRIEREGIRARRLTPVALSNTFPGHVSLATGTTPDQHGIIENIFYDREKGLYAYSGDADWINAEPLWIAAERQGVTAATYFWVGSETDWRGQRSTYRMAPFDGGRPEADKVDKIIDWLDLDPVKRPRLIMSYFRGADSVAHMKGPDHADVTSIIRVQDAELSRLMKALDERDLWPITTLMIVTDHGMTEVTESVAVKDKLVEAGLDVIINGGSSAQQIFLNDEADRAAVLKVLRHQPHIKIYEDEDIPQSMRAPNRTADIVLTTEPPYTFSAPRNMTEQLIVWSAPLLGWKIGAHGFDPDLPDMGGIFFAMGNGVTKGKQVNEVHHLDIAPTVAKLLGIEKPANAIREGIKLD
ncbi:MAG: alkaline phosphatase family protein [Pseudomonadales bacterium]